VEIVVNSDVINNDNDNDNNNTQMSVPDYEFAPYHTNTYLREKYSLNVLYLSTNGPSSWIQNTNWMTLTNPCSSNDDDSNNTDTASWYGIYCSHPTSSTGNNTMETAGAVVSTKSSTTAITSSTTSSGTMCDASPNIIRIELPYNNLSGVLPDELCCMPCLQYLNLDYNNITGDVLWCVNDIATLTDIVLSNNPFNSYDDATTTTTTSGMNTTGTAAATTTTINVGAGFVNPP
jgi:hypothetical protein